MEPSRTVGLFTYGPGSLQFLKERLSSHRTNGSIAFYLDIFFKESNLLSNLPIMESDFIEFIDTTNEPTTAGIDEIANRARDKKNISVIVAIGGGSTLDTGKAISNLLTNEGKAEKYQGWDLVKNKGIYKIGIPTLSGTGSEGSKTCVMNNKAKNLKLGMNSPYTLFDELLLDSDLTACLAL